MMFAASVMNEARSHESSGAGLRVARVIAKQAGWQ
jgi:hypothetical protein